MSRTQHLCPQQMLRAWANGETSVSATMCPRLQGLYTYVMWNRGKATQRHNMWPPDRWGHSSCLFSVRGLSYFLMSWHEGYGYEKLICYGLKRMFCNNVKGLSTEQDDVNSHNCVCHWLSYRKCCRLRRILWPFMLAALLEIFFRTAHNDTGKLKSFL